MAMLCCCRHRARDRREDRLNDAPQFSLASSRACPQQDPIPFPRRDTPPTSESGELQDLQLSSGIVAAVPVNTPSHGPVDLDQLLVDDSDGEDDRNALHRKATSTWKLIRKSMSCIFSRNDAGRNRVPSIGALSQEDLARRAELKRLMHKRIQDELQIEDTVIKSSSEPRTSIQQPLATILEQPGGGPRDTIEFAVDNPDARHPSSSGSMTGPRQSLEAKSPVSSTCGKVCLSTGGKASRPFPTSNSNTLPRQVVWDGTALFDSPKPLREWTQREPHIFSDRDIYSEPIGNKGPIGPERLSSHDSQSLDTTSVLAMWLSAQGMRSRDQSLTRIETTITSCSTSSADLEPPLTDPIAGRNLPLVSLPADLGTNLTQSSSKEADTPAKTGEPAKDQLTKSEPNCHVLDNGISLSPSQDLAESYAIAMAFDDTVDLSSSKYTSVMPSSQVTPATSQPHIPYPFNSQDLQGISTVPYSGKTFVDVPAINLLMWR